MQARIVSPALILCLLECGSDPPLILSGKIESWTKQDGAMLDVKLANQLVTSVPVSGDGTFTVEVPSPMDFLSFIPKDLPPECMVGYSSTPSTLLGAYLTLVVNIPGLDPANSPVVMESNILFDKFPSAGVVYREYFYAKESGTVIGTMICAGTVMTKWPKNLSFKKGWNLLTSTVSLESPGVEVTQQWIGSSNVPLKWYAEDVRFP